MLDEAEAAEAFSILADPTRIAILRAFAEAMDQFEPGADEPTMPVLSFSEVYERVDLDSTSQLSYHLKTLDGTYLRQTDEGWRFTFAGESIVRFLLSGAYAGHDEFERTEVDGRCLYCDAEALRAVVDDLVLFWECTDCEQRMGSFPVTPVQVRNRGAESLLSSTKTRMTSCFWRFRENVCDRCGGTVDVEFHDLSEGDDHDKWLATGNCRQCGRSINGPLTVWFSNHPASVAFHWEHGVDVLSFGFHEMTERLMNGDWRTSRAGPGEYVLTYGVDDAELHLTIDDCLSVLGAERVRADPVVESQFRQ